MKYTPRQVGFFQAVGLAFYITSFAIATRLLQYWYGLATYRLDPIFGTIVILLAFVISAAICGSILLGYPAVLFFENKKSEAVKVVIWSIVWLIILATAIGLAFLALTV